MKAKKTPSEKTATKGQKPRRLAPEPGQFWVLDTGTQGQSSGTIQAHGPYQTQGRAEQWIKETSAADWVGSCGCLRTRGALQDWGDEYIIAQVVRSVRPVPPSCVEMTLLDTENAPTLPTEGAAKNS
jgi:hypothetical protein